MYNSRSRRTNYDGYSRDFVLPENYSGNAFREDSADDVKVDAESESVIESLVENDEGAEEPFERAEDVSEESVNTMGKCDIPLHNQRKPFSSKLGFGFNVGKLFGGSFGVEELLLIGLILLISQNDNNEDIIALLVLLLFIG